MELGAAAGDFFSRRAEFYSVSMKNDADRYFKFIENGFTRDLDRTYYYTIDDLTNQIIPLVTMIIQRSNNQNANVPQAIKDHRP